MLTNISTFVTLPFSVLATTQIVLAQSSVVDQFQNVERQQYDLQAVLPDADSYNFIEANLPHFRGYSGDELVGLARSVNKLVNGELSEDPRS